VFDKFSKYHTNIVIGNFSTKVGMKDIFKPTVSIKSLHKIGMIMELE
jgi:hypothetical protein